MDTQLLVSINDAAAMLGVGRTKVYELVQDGSLETAKLGKRRLVVRSSLDKLVERFSRSGERPSL